MNILFINFNLGATAGINHGVAALSAMLKKKKRQVSLIFLCEELGYDFDLKRLKQDIEQCRPDVIGISLIETQFGFMKDFCRDLQEYYRGPVVVGGPFPSMDPETVLAVPGVHAVCVGEGEDAMTEFVDALESGSDCRPIKNLWIKSSDGSVIRNPLRPFKDLDELPPDDVELFDLKKIVRLKNDQLEVLLGRGCPYQCTYCINAAYLRRYKDMSEAPVGMKQYIRMKSVDRAISELKQILRNVPEVRKIAFIDDNFLSDEKYVEKFSKAYKAEIRLPFVINANPASFNLRKAEFLKQAGCDCVRFGVESGSERIRRDILKRPLSNRALKAALDASRSSGMAVSTYNMIGLPGETRDEIFETLRFNALCRPEFVKVMTFYPFKNTPLYATCRDLGLINEEKKGGLVNYDTFSCLDFPPDHGLFLTKVQTVFHWYLNEFLNNEVSAVYRTRVRQVEVMDEDEWRKFDLDHVEKELLRQCERTGATHYAKKHGRSLAVKMAQMPERNGHA